MKLSSFTDKCRRLIADPVLRAWWFGRAVGRHSRPNEFIAHQPLYLAGQLPLLAETPTWRVMPLSVDADKIGGAHRVWLPGPYGIHTVNSADAFFKKDAEDIEITLARHRFSWLAILGDASANDFYHLWTEWCARFVDVDGWHWHPYTAAERVINVLDAVVRLGWPGDVQLLAHTLARHAPEIAKCLEYFGDHDTSNHLSNNGRGLYRLGLALQMPATRQMGFDILKHEAARIFTASGVQREGSIHYHYLCVRNYIDAWRVAENAGQSEDATYLRDICRRLLATARSFVIGDRMPLIGDISPDSPPAFLDGLESGTCAWTKTLPHVDQDHIFMLAQNTSPTPRGALLDDGWLRADFGAWEIMSRVPPEGWPFMPGHAHQDMTSVVACWRNEPIFIDPGRGAYGETGDAHRYRSHTVHGGVFIDDVDPYPANKPYYTDDFRHRLAGPAEVAQTEHGFSICHAGYRRIMIESTKMAWRFDDDVIQIDVEITGHGRHRVDIAFCSQLPVRETEQGFILGERFRVRSNHMSHRTDPMTVWTAYGVGDPAHRLVFSADFSASWQGAVVVEPVI